MWHLFLSVKSSKFKTMKRFINQHPSSQMVSYTRKRETRGSHWRGYEAEGQGMDEKSPAGQRLGSSVILRSLHLIINIYLSLLMTVTSCKWLVWKEWTWKIVFLSQFCVIPIKWGSSKGLQQNFYDFRSVPMIASEQPSVQEPWQWSIIRKKELHEYELELLKVLLHFSLL